MELRPRASVELRRRETAPELRSRYLAAGHWTDDTLTSLVDDALGRLGHLELRVWSRTRPSRSTVHEVGRRARALAAGLAARDVGPGDVVAFQLPNWEEAAVTFYGAALLGVVLVPVVPFYGPKELSFILGETRARVLVTADRFGHLDYLAGLERMRPALPDLELVAVVGAGPAPGDAIPFDRLAEDDSAGLVPARPDPDDPAVIAYTSGTTSSPKGVIHTHRSMVAELRQITAMGAQPARPLLCGAPVGHAIGMQSGLLNPLLRSISIHLIDQWDPGAVLAAMAEAGLTAGSGSTYFLTSLLDHPDCSPEHIRLIGSVGLGGSPVPAAVAERAEALGIGLVRSYGSTELPSTTGSFPDAPRHQRLFTDGAPMPGVELRLLDADGREVPTGEPGEIVARGPELFVGYTDPALDVAVDADGWYATGDIGVLDEHGCLTITDRKKDIIIRGGENISAAEVEELLVRLPGVAEVAVVAAPDPRMGEHACAFVRTQPGASPPALDDVRRHLETAGLARVKWPEELRVVDELPRTPSGKVQKFVLRDRLRAEAR